MIHLRIDVSKIDKERLFKGKKGTYLNLIGIETPNSEYGTHLLKQEISKEEREGGLEMPILGGIQKIERKSPTESSIDLKEIQDEADKLIKQGKEKAEDNDLPF